MIIVKTTNGDRFINDAETLQVNHVKDKAQVEVWPSRWGNQQQQPQYYVIEHVEQVIYTDHPHDVDWVDNGSELEKLKAQYDEHLKWGSEIRAKYMDLMNECDEMRERLASLEKQPTPGYENDRLIDTVYNEIDRLDIQEREEDKKKYPEWRVHQKRGNAIRFMNVAKDHDIETVGQLLAVGRARFEQFRNMGRLCADRISEALKNLYGITQW